MNTTAPLLRTHHRPLRRPAAATTVRTSVDRLRASLRHRRYDDRPGIERNASLSELTLRPHQHLGGRI